MGRFFNRHWSKILVGAVVTLFIVFIAFSAPEGFPEVYLIDGIVAGAQQSDHFAANQVDNTIALLPRGNRLAPHTEVVKVKPLVPWAAGWYRGPNGITDGSTHGAPLFNVSGIYTLEQPVAPPVAVPIMTHGILVYGLKPRRKSLVDQNLWIHPWGPTQWSRYD